MKDFTRSRRDFPILQRTVHGKPLVYLDNAATTHRPGVVLEAEAQFVRESNANIHRGIHTLSEEATERYESVRAHTARFLEAGAPESIIFTRNTTESINLVAYAWGRKFLKAGDEILLTAAEHHSNLIPWQQVAAATGAALQFIPLTAEGELDLAAMNRLLTPRTKMVAMTVLSNAIGTRMPVQAVLEKARQVGAKVLLDGAQAVPHQPFSLRETPCDFLAFSAHKMLGPTGVGVLYGKPELLEAMNPFLTGGDMILEVWRDHAKWNRLPWKFEAGTPDIGGVIAFGAALTYLENCGMAAIREHEKKLTAYALDRLLKDPKLLLYGPKDPERRGGVVSFNYGSVHPHDLGTLLDQEGIAIRAGHHCCQPLMRDLGVSGTARASFYFYNTTEEIDRLAEALPKAAAFFSRA